MNIIKQRIKLFRFTERLVDILLIYLSLILAVSLNGIYYNFEYINTPLYYNVYFLLFIFLIWIILIQIFEHDLIYRSIYIWKIIKNIFFISLIGVTTIITMTFLLQIEIFNRFTIIVFGFCSFILLTIKRSFLKYLLSYIRHEGMNTKNILIVGVSKRTKRLIKEFSYHQEYGLKINAIINPDPKILDTHIKGIKIYNDITQFKKIILMQKIDEVFFALDMTIIPNVSDVLEYLDTIGVNYHIMINEAVHNYSKEHANLEPQTSYYYGIPMLSFRAISANYIKLYIKTIVEKILALILFVLAIPILIIFGLLIKLTTNGPIFFKQEGCFGFSSKDFIYVSKARSSSPLLI